MRSFHRYKMALMKRLQKAQEDPVPVDITHNLKSLQFDSALSEEEKQLIHLRPRSHALTVTACTQATYFASILHEARQLRKQLKSPQKLTAKILQDKDARDPLRVGIIGCGRFGSQLAHCLLTYGGVNPKDLRVSTRRPETLEYLQNKGVECFHDNIKLVSTSHLVFLCVLPSQIQFVAEEIKEHVPATAILYSFVATYSAKRLKQLITSSNIIHPEYSWTEESEQNAWNLSVNVNNALEKPETVEKTCPLGYKKSESVIMTNTKLVEILIFSFLNMCTTLRLNKKDSLNILHTVMFNEIEEDRLKEEDFIKKTADIAGVFPRFDLVRIIQIKTSVQRRLTDSEHLRKAFVSKYLQMFDEYVKKKAMLGLDTERT